MTLAEGTTIALQALAKTMDTSKPQADKSLSSYFILNEPFSWDYKNLQGQRRENSLKRHEKGRVGITYLNMWVQKRERVMCYSVHSNQKVKKFLKF